MNAPLRKIILAGAAASAAVGAVLSACQSYQAEVVTPVAIKAVNQQVVIMGEFVKPRVMIVVDRSGSMMDSVTGDGSGCSKNNVYDPTSTQACKWKDLRNAFAGADGLLPKTRDMAYFGLTVFPGSTSNACSAGQTVVSISDSSDNVDAIMNQLLNALVPAGGTPIATTLQNLLDDPQMAPSRENQRVLVMLLTDGLPNCNGANRSICDTCKAAGCGSFDACTECSNAPCSATFPVGSRTSCFAENPCLDGHSTVAAVRALNQRGIKTFIIGFGQVTSGGSAADILNQAAVEGGLPRDVGAPTRFYQASSQDKLKSALDDFVRRNIPTCKWTLSPTPTSDQVVQVVKNDAVANTSTVLVRNADYSLTGNSVQLLDALCAEVMSAPARRYTYEFRYVSDL